MARSPKKTTKKKSNKPAGSVSKTVSRPSALKSSRFINVKHNRPKQGKSTLTLSFTVPWFASKPKISSRKIVKKSKKPAVSRRTLSRLVAYTLLIISIAGISWTAWIYFSSTQPVQNLSGATELKPAVSAEVKETHLSESLPTKLSIPAIGIETGVITTGKNSDGSLDVPEDANIAAWYQYSPTPGEIGPSVIVGHLDSVRGPGIFFNLHQLKSGDLVQIARQDGTLVTFRVDKQALYDQSNFPTNEVYGNIDSAGLRLISCGGEFNLITRQYSHNVVVYASLVNAGQGVL